MTLPLFLYDCIYDNDVIHCWSIFLFSILNMRHVLCTALFIILYASYLLCFHEFFLLIHLLCVVTLLLSLSIVMGSVFLLQLYWILLLDFLSSHHLLLLAILLSNLIYLQICYFHFEDCFIDLQLCYFFSFNFRFIIYDFLKFCVYILSLFSSCGFSGGPVCNKPLWYF